MKIFAFSLAGFFLALFAGIFIFTALAGWFFTATRAEELTPLDFAADCDKFEVQVGFDRINGRYATYHYEF